MTAWHGAPKKRTADFQGWREREAIRTYHGLRIRRAVENLCRHRFEAHAFESAAEAVDYFFANISPTATVGHGGSETLWQIGIGERLRAGQYNFLDRTRCGHSYEEQLDIRRRTLSADVFVASSNAVSIEGAIVNIDGVGNRVSAIGFGPRRVYLFIGRNKLCDDLDGAIHRAREYAAVALAIQLGIDTPCTRTGFCHDCNSPERICSNLSIIERSDPPGRITVLLINEDLGL